MLIVKREKHKIVIATQHQSHYQRMCSICPSAKTLDFFLAINKMPLVPFVIILPCNMPFKFLSEKYSGPELKFLFKF